MMDAYRTALIREPAKESALNRVLVVRVFDVYLWLLLIVMAPVLTIVSHYMWQSEPCRDSAVNLTNRRHAACSPGAVGTVASESGTGVPLWVCTCSKEPHAQ